ncbi:MAG: hypothetical protein JXA30_02820 [Deltaproteobacteria bacterium]|nr:hypothetical protein [Deltaproteobacteria bacterium]
MKSYCLLNRLIVVAATLAGLCFCDGSSGEQQNPDGQGTGGTTNPAGSGDTASGGTSQSDSGLGISGQPAAGENGSLSNDAGQSTSGRGGANPAADASADGESDRCGDGTIDPGEACDGVDLGDQTCESLGLGSGQLKCDPTCHLDQSECAGSASEDAEINDTENDGGDPPSISCPNESLMPGERSESFMHDGLQREFLIFIPSSYDNTKPFPLVLNFHGATSYSEQQRDFSDMNPTAEEKGFIVVYPQGIGNTWNAGVCCGEAASSRVDDVGFARAIVDYMRENTCIDFRRVYATGMSNGGRMSYRLGCEAADVFAAIAPVAGTKSFPDDQNSPGCQPSRPISLIDFMGTADSRIEVQPGQVAEWVRINGCTDAEPTETHRQGEHFCATYSQCEAETSVTYCVVENGGHCWPGSYPCSLGNTSRPEELSANELMWELFERSSL